MRPFLYPLSLPPSPSPPCPSLPPFSTRPSRPFWLTSQTQMNSNRIEMIRFRVSFGLSGSDSPLTKTATKSVGLSTCESFDPSSVVRLRFRLSGAGGQRCGRKRHAHLDRVHRTGSASLGSQVCSSHLFALDTAPLSTRSILQPRISIPD